jgi:hypothetical protein
MCQREVGAQARGANEKWARFRLKPVFAARAVPLAAQPLGVFMEKEVCDKVMWTRRRRLGMAG